jgi:hypothetical protein
MAPIPAQTATYLKLHAHKDGGAHDEGHAVHAPGQLRGVDGVGGCVK